MRRPGLAHPGLKHTRYDATTVNQASVGLEHYFSSFSWLVSFSPVRASAPRSTAARCAGNYYYGDRNSVGLIAAVGEEATPVGGNNVVIADIKATTLVGTHWVSPQWAVNYALGSTSQGSFYNPQRCSGLRARLRRLTRCWNSRIWAGAVSIPGHAADGAVQHGAALPPC